MSVPGDEGFRTPPSRPTDDLPKNRLIELLRTAGKGEIACEPILVQNEPMLPKLKAVFFAEPGSEPPAQPVRAWLRRLPKHERAEIGSDIQAVQFGWPLGLPLVRHLKGDLWEVRSRPGNRIARVIFAVSGDTMVLLHAFFKTGQKTPVDALALAEKRWNKIGP